MIHFEASATALYFQTVITRIIDGDHLSTKITVSCIDSSSLIPYFASFSSRSKTNLSSAPPCLVWNLHLLQMAFSSLSPKYEMKYIASYFCDHLQSICAPMAVDTEPPTLPRSFEPVTLSTRKPQRFTMGSTPSSIRQAAQRFTLCANGTYHLRQSVLESVA